MSEKWSVVNRNMSRQNNGQYIIFMISPLFFLKMEFVEGDEKAKAPIETMVIKKYKQKKKYSK